MAHMIDNSKGFDAFAFRGEQGWHGLGQPILPEDTSDDIRIKCGADYNLKIKPVMFEREFLNAQQELQTITETAENRFVVYRDDTGSVLNVVTERYKPVQTKTMFDAMAKWCKECGFQIETAGVLCGGGRYWVTANTSNQIILPGKDRVAQYVNIATSADGSMPTEAFTGETRIVCNNTLQAARHSNVLNVRNRHSTEVDWDAISIKLELVTQAWKDFTDKAKMMAETAVKKSDQVNLIIAATQGFKTGAEIEKWKAEQEEKKVAQFMQRWSTNFSAAPGADLASAKGMLWGIVNAVTYDIDHNGGGRTAEARFINAQWGKGNEIKNRIWELCNKAANKELDFVNFAVAA